MTTRKVTHKDAAAASAMLDRERSTAKKVTGDVTRLRHCSGSARFGIERHDAPEDDFPKQPSQPDGLGRMCGEHWKLYVQGLREARATKAADTDAS